MISEIVKSNAKCPKCQSNNLLLIEVWKDHEITWEQKDGIFDRRDGNIEPGDPYKVEAECRNCGHKWRIRKALQITDIVSDEPQ